MVDRSRDQELRRGSPRPSEDTEDGTRATALSAPQLINSAAFPRVVTEHVRMAAYLAAVRVRAPERLLAGVGPQVGLEMRALHVGLLAVWDVTTVYPRLTLCTLSHPRQRSLPGRAGRVGAGWSGLEGRGARSGLDRRHRPPHARGVDYATRAAGVAPGAAACSPKATATSSRREV